MVKNKKDVHVAFPIFGALFTPNNVVTTEDCFPNTEVEKT